MARHGEIDAAIAHLTILIEKKLGVLVRRGVLPDHQRAALRLCLNARSDLELSKKLLRYGFGKRKPS